MTLSVEHITKSFGEVEALRDVTLTVELASVTGLIGPNGAGKSTLLDVVSGFARCDVGKVRLDGQEITTRSAGAIARSGVARTFQHATPFHGLSVWENLLVAAGTHGRGGRVKGRAQRSRPQRSRPRLDGQIEDIIDMCFLRPWLSHDSSDLPFGTLRMLEVARCMVRRPRVLLLDEPAAGLNSSETDSLSAALRSIQEMGVGVLLIDHDVQFVFGICAKLNVLDFGSLIASGSPQEIRSDSGVRRAYLGSPAS